MLLNANADPNMEAQPGALRRESPLCAAVSHGHFGVVKLLLERGTVLNKKASPLFLLSKKYQPKLANLLLEYGADPNQYDLEGKTPLSQAAYHA